MSSDDISVIRVQELTGNEEIEESSREEEVKNDRKSTLKDMFEAFGISAFGIVGFSLLFILPWTSIPRTDSIIYQSHWMEVILPFTSFLLLPSGIQILSVATWTQETTLMTFPNFVKIYFTFLIPDVFLYISLSVLWSVYLENNHPLPFLAIPVYLPTIMISVIGLWFILPRKLLKRHDFRQKLKIFNFYHLWLVITLVIKETLSSLFINPPGGFQFLVPFLVGGCRKLDKRLRSKVVKNMTGE